jgi:hypothetical protein
MRASPAPLWRGSSLSFALRATAHLGPSTGNAADTMAEHRRVGVRHGQFPALISSPTNECVSSLSLLSSSSGTLCSVLTSMKRRRRSSASQRFSGGLLQPTRPVLALVPVAASHSDRHGNRAAYRKHLAAQNWQPLSRSFGLAGGSVGNLGPPLLQVPRSPGDLLDDMPVYTPSDDNAPPLARMNIYSPMRSIPFSAAVPFFFRRQDVSGGGGGGHHDVGDHLEEGEAEDGRGETRVGHARQDSDAPLYCRLCREEVPSPLSPRTHITVANTGSHSSHPVREVVLDTLALLAGRGYPIDDILTVWAETLFNSPDLPRIQGMASPQWTIEKRAAHLSDLLFALKKVGVIDVSLARQSGNETKSENAMLELTRRRGVGFDRLEYIGDNFWGTHIMRRLVRLYPDQQWMYGERSFFFNAVRDACEMNTNLDFVFDLLRLEGLHTAMKGELGVGKAKADFVEGLLGELHSYVISFEPKLEDDVAYVEVNDAREAQLCALIQHCLTELYDLVVLQHARQLLPTVLPLAKELAVRQMWRQMQPELLSTKRFLRFHRRERPPATELTNITAPAAALSAKPIGERDDAGPVVVTASEPAADPTSEDDGGAPEEGMLADITVVPTAAGTASSALETAALTLAASIRRGTTRILPGLPRLFTTPRVRPTVIPHPLQHLPPSAIPRSTYCQHTDSDVFAQLIASYHRLHLLSDDARQTRYVVSPHPPRWTALIATLVPQLALVVAIPNYNAETSADASASATGLPNADLLIFSRGLPTEAAGAKRQASDGGDGSGAAAAAVTLNESSGLHAGGMQSAELTRRLFACMDSGELYCRDSLYDLAKSPTLPVAPTLSSSSAPSLVQWSLCHVGLPALTAKPTHAASSATTDGGRGGVADGSALRTFADSRFVPPGTRPPPAGVVTDRNLCRGVFAFLAFGEEHPVRTATLARGGVSQMTSMRNRSNDDEQAGEQTALGSVTAPPAAADPATLSAEEVQAAVVYWRRRRQTAAVDADLLLAERTSLTQQR